jgi:DNA polymerase-4
MTWGRSYSFPRAIVHIDGDSFFAAVEVAKNPALRGKPVITGKERGIVSACTYEAKARGVKRGVKLSEALQACPDAIVLPSDYETYSIFSERMYEIVRRYTPAVEEYSIDECFADLTGLRRLHKMNYRDMAHSIKQELQVELGMTFSVGLSVTKVLAKIGSKWRKPDGFTSIPLNDASKYLGKLPVGHVWGIGPNTAAYLEKCGVRTALDFTKKDEPWVKAHVP